MSYRAVLAGAALTQFDHLLEDQEQYAAFMDRLVILRDAPWDAWPALPGGEDPPPREAQFGENGLMQFRVDDQAETLIIVNLL